MAVSLSLSLENPKRPNSSSNPLEQKTILLDLDETLVHSEPWVSNKTYDVVLNMAEPDSKVDEKIGVFIRPFAHKFLQKLN